MPKEQKSALHCVNHWTGREAYLLAVVCLFAGLMTGYLFRGSTGSSAAAAHVEAAAPATGSAGDKTPLHSAEAMKPLAAPLLAALQVNPKNPDISIQLGNLYFDNHVYPEAIEHYRRALDLKPDDFNVRTDLGTAYWYSGFAEKAVAEYEKVLAARPGYSPTLLNLGIVRLEGLKDPAAAASTWEELLKANPEYADKQRVLEMIARARSRKG